MNAATGDVIWTYQGIVETARMLTAPAPAVVDEVVIAPGACDCGWLCDCLCSVWRDVCF